MEKDKELFDLASEIIWQIVSECEADWGSETCGGCSFRVICATMAQLREQLKAQGVPIGEGDPDALTLQAYREIPKWVVQKGGR